ncbi:MAG: hypothetical protein ACKO5M_10965 [Vulcanococcus sp.]
MSKAQALAGINGAGPTEADAELWQEVRQSSPEQAVQARIIRVLRPSPQESRETYSNTTL